MRPGSPSLAETVLRRDRWIVAAGLAGIAALAWIYLLAGAGMEMSVWDMMSVSLFPHRLPEMAMDGMEGMTSEDIAAMAVVWTPDYWLIMLLMWWIMMIAMMTPSAAPTVLLYARVTRNAQATGQVESGAVPTAVFVGGYLSAWLLFSAAATLVTWGFEQGKILSAMTMSSRSAWLSAGILVAVGLYQLSPLKHACLRTCRTPADFLSRHWRPGRFGAYRMGLEHGAYCIGCCWVLMGLLFVGGVMNIVWIAVLGLFVLIEKITPPGLWIGRLAGVVLLAWAAATMVV